MPLRPTAFSIPTTTQLKITFTDLLSEDLSISNFSVSSLNGSVDDLEIIGIEIDEKVVIIKTRPQVSGNYYLLKFLDTSAVPFTSNRGDRLIDDSNSRELFFVGIDNVNPFRDRLLESVPGLFEIENTVLKDILSAQAEELYKAQKTIGKVLSNNYISVDVVDEPRTRTAGATDRLANENAYQIDRVSSKLTGTAPKFAIIDYTSANALPRSHYLPYYPVSLQQTEVIDEIITINSEENSFDGFLISVKNKNIIKLLNIKLIKASDEEDCDGNIGTEYDIELFKYSIHNNYYDQDYAFSFLALESNQILLSEFGNIDRPETLDTIEITYLYKNLGRNILEDDVEVSRVEEITHESLPTNTVRFFLKHAPIVTESNVIPSIRGVSFYQSENSSDIPLEFKKELIFNTSKLPSKPGEYSINYETGEVYLVGATTDREGTGRNNYVASYFYRKEFIHNTDYVIHEQDLVAIRDRDLVNEEAQISIRYDEVFVEGIDYLAKTHIEVMPEFIENRLTQSFKLRTEHTPITDVFRILNQTTGEVYNYLYHTDTEVSFSGNQSPKIKSISSEEATFSKVINENLTVIGEFIIPAFRVRITSNASNNSIMFEPGIPAELISYNSDEYFFRQIEDETPIGVEDLNIRYFGDSDSNGMIYSASISLTASPPTVNQEAWVGTKGFIINLDKTGILNKNNDALGSIINTSLEFSDSTLFQREKYFEPISISPTLSKTDQGGLSRSLTIEKNSIFDENISRLRKVGDYVVDYEHGVIYLAITKDQDIFIDTVTYSFSEITAKNKNVLTASGITKKLNAPQSIEEASIIYDRISSTTIALRPLDLESTLLVWDNETTATDLDDEQQIIAEVLDDYTVVLPHNILSINGIFKLVDLTGDNLKSINAEHRLSEYTLDELTPTVVNNGRNLYDISSVTFEKNVIDLKKKATKRVTLTDSGLIIYIYDNTASTFVSAKSVSSDLVIFDDELNITKVSGLQISGITESDDQVVVEIPSGTDLSSIDTENDYLLDVNGKRFAITAIDTFYSTVTVESPAINDITVTAPAIDAAGETLIIVKPTVVIENDVMIITIPTDAPISNGSLIEVTYLTNLIPAIGTPLAIDYRFGFIFIDYSYVADEVAIWYEYGDNELDWSISGALDEGSDYFVTYKFGALRNALRTNFGSLTNIPFFQTFGLSIDRELYRDAVSGTLQAFPKGPTLPAFKELIKSFTKIDPEIAEITFGSWILGRDYLTPGLIKALGVLEFSDGKFKDGLKINKDNAVIIPAISAISVDEGTIETWVRPDWSGINNDALLTIDLDHIGTEKIVVKENYKLFNSEHNWDLIPTNNLIGNSDDTGSGIIISNFKSDSNEAFGLNQGYYGIYKNIDSLNQVVKSDFEATLKIDFFGNHFNDLRKVITEGPEIYNFTNDFNPTTSLFTGVQGPGSYIGGEWPENISSPSTTFSFGSLLLADGIKTNGVSLNLRTISGFIFETENATDTGGIDDVSGDELPKYNNPHMTRNCRCTLDFNVPDLEVFNDYIVNIELSTDFDFEDFKASVNFIDETPEVFILVDTQGIFYSIVGFYDSSNNLNTTTIPDSFIRFAVKRFGESNTALSAQGSEAINAVLPSGVLRLMYKSADILTKYDTSKSVSAFDFTKYHVIDWTKSHTYKIIRNPLENLVQISIDNQNETFFYTDSFLSLNLDIDLSVDSSELKGILIGIFGNSSISSMSFLRGNGSVYNRFGLNDIYIGAEGYHPSKIPFSVHKDDFPLVSLGEPASVATEQGIFIWFDELCQNTLLEDTGQWIFRTKAARSLDYPSDVIVTGLGQYENILTTDVINHSFSGSIITDGEFSSVIRSHRDELGDCDLGVTCNATFRYCANELLEDFGWNKIEESDSDLVNLLVSGRTTQRSKWRKHGDFNTSVSSGIYRMGETAHQINCTNEDLYLGNLVYTATPCTGGNFEITSSVKISQIDVNIISTDLGSFSGGISGNLTGIVPIHINDLDVNIKIALAFNVNGDELILVIDVRTNQIIDIISYSWNDQEFHEYKLEKNKDNGVIDLYVDNYLVSQSLITDFSSTETTEYFSEPNIAVYAFDALLVDSELYHQNYEPNIIDIDLIFFAGYSESGDGYLESTDIIINTDSRVEFEFNIDDEDFDAYDEIDGYSDIIGVDEMLIVSDKIRYLVDSGVSAADRRLSIFKDGKGFLNFRIIDDSISNGNEAGIFNLATNIRYFEPGELYHIAASWKLNTIDEKDEMHLFINGQEVPNIYKFGGNVPVKLNDKFRDVSKETLYNFTVNDISFCDNYTDGTISASSAIFTSDSAGFTQSHVGRTLLFNSSDMAPTLINKEYIIRSVVDSSQVTLGRGTDLDLLVFDVSASDINYSFAPIAGLISPILTDLKNSKVAIFRTDINGEETELSGLYYTVEDGEIDFVRGTNSRKPKFRVNLTDKIIEFVGENSLCETIATIRPTDLDVHIETFGLNIEKCKYNFELFSSSYSSDEGVFSGKSVVRTRGAEPVDLSDVNITRTILKNTIIDIVDPIQLDNGYYQVDFTIELDNEKLQHSVSSESNQIYNQNLGRLITLKFDSDNIDFCEFDGYEDGYQDGSLDSNLNTVTIYGETTDGFNEETYFIDKNGYIHGAKFFTEITSISGTLQVIDADSVEAAMISLIETNPISVSDNSGEYAEIYEYKNGHFIITINGTNGTMPFELHPGFYQIEYPAYLTLNLSTVGDKLFIGTDFNQKHYFGGVIDDFRIISEMSSDTRSTEIISAGTRSVTDDYNRSIPFCPDSQTLTLIPFNNPIDLQSRRLRNTTFLDSKSNTTYKLDRKLQEQLLEVVNNEIKFTSLLINNGYSIEESTRAFYEVHKAQSGPLFNIADMYRNFVEFPKSDQSVNSSFNKSGNFTQGKGILLINDDGKFRKKEGTIELWVSPIIDTSIDTQRRHYIDISTANRERIKSTSSTVIELPNAANQIISIKLLKGTEQYSTFYTDDEKDQILFDEITRSKISGRLEGGTGIEKDFFTGSSLSSNGRKINLATALPGQNIDVIVTYVPLDSNGDRFSVFKNEYNQIVFSITADGVDNVVTKDIDWRKNTWHRIMCIFKTNSSSDTMRIFIDGDEGGEIRYGSGLVYGTDYIYGQYAQSEGQVRNIDLSINVEDELRLISIGSDVFGENSARARLDNIRFSSLMRTTVRNSVGDFIDLNYSENLNTVSPVVKDDITTLLLDFDEDLEKINKFASIIDPKYGIYNFDINVIDNFDKVIGINNGEIEDLIVELVKRLKPAHTNALVKFTKSEC